MISRIRYGLLAVLVICSTIWANELVNSATKSLSKQNCPEFSSLDKNHDDLISREEGLNNEFVDRQTPT